MKKIFLITLISAFTISISSCADSKKKEEEDKAQMEKMEAEREAQLEEERKQEEMESNSIAAKAMETDTLSTLVSALQTAEMAEFFTVSEGPFTVFAPNNAAFEKVDKATLDNLMMTENQEQLSGLLEYHVVEDEVTAQELIKMINDNDGEYTISTLAGADIVASLEGENVILTDENGNKATVVSTDIDASNGVVHIIDAVVMPKNE